MIPTSELTKLLAEATKAPWNIEGDGIYGKTSDGYTVQLFEYYASDEVARAEANARLIALAPVLAARVVALEAALTVCKRSIDGGGGGGVTCVVWADTCPSETLCDFIDAALAAPTKDESRG